MSAPYKEKKVRKDKLPAFASWSRTSRLVLLAAVILAVLISGFICTISGISMTELPGRRASFWRSPWKRCCIRSILWPCPAVPVILKSRIIS